MRARWNAILLAAVLPALAAKENKSDWSRLKQLTMTQIVRLHLRDGRVLTGYVQDFRIDGLSFISETKPSVIKTRDIESTTLSEVGQVRTIKGRVSFERGQAVELKMRDGRVTQGTVQRFSATDGQLWLVEANSVQHLDRADILKVMAKRSGRRARNALIGAAAGGVILWGVGRAGSDPKCFEANAHCTGVQPGALGVLGGLVGAIGGALFPVKGWAIVYQA